MREFERAISDIGNKAIRRDIPLEVAKEQFNGIKAVLSWRYAISGSSIVRSKIDRLKSIMDSSLAVVEKAWANDK